MIELLVTVSIIALLIALLLPGLVRGRGIARQAECMAGQNQLSQGYFNYAADNDYRIMRGVPANDPEAFVYSGASESAITRGALWEYVKVLSYYQCPDDPLLEEGNLRSYSLPGTLYGEGWQNDYTRGTDTYIDIKNPSAQLLWLEESDRRGWNMGSWIIYCDSGRKYKWIDYVGLFHENETADGVGFLDGHVEIKIWEDPDTVRAGINNQFYMNDSNNPDWEWLRPRYRQLQTEGNVEFFQI